MLANRLSPPKWQYKEVDGQRQLTSKTVVFRTTIAMARWQSADYKQQAIADWTRTEAGKWAHLHSVEPMVIEQYDDVERDYSHYAVVARFTEQDTTFYTLKYL